MDEQRYPVDEISKQTKCKLYLTVTKILIRVAYGMPIAIELGMTFHGSQIPAGYSIVGVEKIYQGYDDLELDISGGQGEIRIHETSHGMILGH